MYAGDFDEFYPRPGAAIDWGDTDPLDGTYGWMYVLWNEGYIKSPKVYSCQSFSKYVDSPYAYFLSARAAYLKAGEHRASTCLRYIKASPSVFIVGGDENFRFPHEPDCDKDDYNNNCLVFGEDATHWKPHHQNGFNILFADGHVTHHKQWNPELMTFRYDRMAGYDKDALDP